MSRDTDQAELLAMEQRNCKHKWDGPSREVGRTGDWFHPLIIEFSCSKCGVTKTEDV